MARILVTGSAQGIGAGTARALIALGHHVTVHGRSPERADAALAQAPGATGAVVGDFASLASVRELASQARAAGPFDAVIHNVGLGPDQPARRDTVDGHEQMLQINVIGPYLLTCLMPLSARMVFIGSDAHRQGEVRLDDLEWRARAWEGDPWPGLPAYSDSKLLFQMWVFEFAARVPEAAINVVHPGWVQTAMGGPNAAIPVAEGADTPVWMATADDPLALGSGAFVHRRAAEHVHPASVDPAQRAAVVARLEDITGEALPSA
ncbi:SDR family NAD(P)-dependent oxidoreductase [uncultured Demequina sp.]|uniref:SDR family NAD(P)-dependent oxidoreductase n=1 Tax=uncultured Demequina sp. TaxID=693499 RepID=UPI0025E559B6|nr:SDR family NAD(P)-dependent oxidoreductase [uncultured Demequina sp.]